MFLKIYWVIHILVTAQSATLKEDKLNEVQLFEVNAEIIQKIKKLFIFTLKQLIIIK